jgi:ribosome-associated protein
VQVKVTPEDRTEGTADERDVIVINDELAVPRSELRYRASRSGGPGGQHVNTSSTRIELEFDVDASPSLTVAQRAAIRERLANRIAADGVLRLSSRTSRSQYQNREDVTARFQRLLEDALRVRKPRRKTKVPRAVKEARLKAKKRRAKVKKQRGPVSRDE